MYAFDKSWFILFRDMMIAASIENKIKPNLFLKQHKESSKIVKYIEKNPILVIIYKTIGYVDIELVFNVENIGKFHQIMEDLTIKFPYLIKNYTYMGDLETHKYEYFA